MSSWRIAESLKRLREQVNALYPNRDKSSDGSIGDRAHRNRKSDHNPNSANVVTAVDIDKDLAPGVSVKTIVEQLFKSGDPRIKYLIFEGKITLPKLTGWKKYTGPNGHFQHVHISVSSDPKLYDSNADWNIDGKPSPLIPQPPVETVSDLKIGDRGADVVMLQEKLRLPADGIFGLNTKKAVINIQVKNNLRADGIVGKKTRAAIGL